MYAVSDSYRLKKYPSKFQGMMLLSLSLPLALLFLACKRNPFVVKNVVILYVSTQYLYCHFNWTGCSTMNLPGKIDFKRFAKVAMGSNGVRALSDWQSFLWRWQVWLRLLKATSLSTRSSMLVQRKPSHFANDEKSNNKTFKEID